MMAYLATNVRVVKVTKHSSSARGHDGDGDDDDGKIGTNKTTLHRKGLST